MADSPVVDNIAFLMNRVFNHANFAVMFIDTTGNIIQASDELAKMVGWRRRDFIGQSVFTFLHPDERAEAKRKWAELNSGLVESYKAERRYRRRNGSDFWVEASSIAVFDNDGVVAGYFVQLTGIDRQKRAEAAMDAAEKRWSFALDSAGQGVWDYDVILGTWYFSPGWKRMRGIPEDEEVDGNEADWLETVHPEDREMVQTCLRQQHDGEIEDIAFAYRERHRDGHWMWILARGKCVEHDAQDRPQRIIGTDTDITDLKETENRLDQVSQSELRWKVAVESAAQGVWEHDFVTGTSYHSEGWRRMRGIKAGEPEPGTEQEWLEFIHPDDRARVTDYMAKQDSGEISEIEYEYRERHRDGHWIWILARGRCVEYRGDGRPKRIVGIDTDITDLKTREEQLARLSRRHALALSTSRIGIWETDVATRHTEWDARTRAIFGIPPDLTTIPSNAWADSIHPDDREDVLKLVDNALHTLTDYSVDYRIVLPNGDIRHVRCVAAYYQDAAEGVKALGVNWDVSADYLKAEELRSATALAEDRNLQLEAARAEMEHNSLHDPLTGLPNRRFLDAKLVRLASDETTGRKSVAVLNIDLDRFKQINDTLGHAAGDAMLIHVAKLLRQCVRETDTVARIGGDEFVVVLSPDPGPGQLDALVRRVVEYASKPLVIEGQECRSGVSVGIARADGQKIDARQLLVNSDIALYRAKAEGRNRAVTFTDVLQREILATKQYSDDMLKALECGEFIAFYQPQFDAHTLDLTGVEALVRWSHPTRGLLAPATFMPAAEELNAIAMIDRMILEQSLADQAGWKRAGLEVPRVSVNVSARRLRDENLIAGLKKLRIKRGTISFELLESIFLDDENDLAGWNIDQIKELGIDIDVDDFGTGHASIVSLLRLNPRRLKIDRQIVLPITESETQRRLVRSIVEIGKSQNIEVCAEGVETLEHVNILRDLGCDVLQGFYFARPMPRADLTQFLREQTWRRAS